MAKGKYKEWLENDNLLLLEAWARDGLTDKQIAHNIGISVKTLYEWKNSYRDICESLKKGKEVVDIQVENALLKRALGYEYVEETKERLIDGGQKKRIDSKIKLTEKEWGIIKSYFDDSCCYCGDPSSLLTRDHLVPLAKGGKLTIDNVVPCCKSCNSSKKDNEWLSWFQKQSFYSKKRAEKILSFINFVTSLASKTDNDDGELVVTKQVKRHVLPDVTAQIFWLKNRKFNQWRDKREVENNINFKENVEENLTLEELKSLAKANPIQ